MNFKGPAPTPTPWRRHHRRAAGPRAPPAGRPSRRAGPLAGGAAHPGLRQPSPHPIFRHLGRYRRRPPLYCATSAGPKTGPGPPAHVPVALPPCNDNDTVPAADATTPAGPATGPSPRSRLRCRPGPATIPPLATVTTTVPGPAPSSQHQPAPRPLGSSSRSHLHCQHASAPGTLVTTSAGSTPARAEPALPSTTTVPSPAP